MNHQTSLEHTRTETPPFGLPLFISGVRCLVQYVFLPFVLPFFGAGSESPAWLGLVLNAVATASLLLSLQRFYRSRHPKRQMYLLLALPMFVLIGVFTVNDLRSL